MQVIDSIGNIDEFVELALVKNKQLVDGVFEMVNCFMERVKEFDFVFHKRYQEDKLKQTFKGISFDEIRRQMLQLKNAKNDSQKILFKDELKCGMFLINCKNIRVKLSEQIEQVIKSIIDLLLIKVGKENKKLGDEIKEIKNKLKAEPQNLEELDDLRTFAKDINVTLDEINKKIMAIMNKVELVEEMQHKITYEEFASSWSSFGFPLKVRKRAQNT